MVPVPLLRARCASDAVPHGGLRQHCIVQCAQSLSQVNIMFMFYFQFRWTKKENTFPISNTKNSVATGWMVSAPLGSRKTLAEECWVIWWRVLNDGLDQTREENLRCKCWSVRASVPCAAKEGNLVLLLCPCQEQVVWLSGVCG